MKITTYTLIGLLLFATSCTNKDTIPEKNTKASFSADGYEKPIPCKITFINNSSNATSVEWDFGDGGTSTDFNPEHTYTNWGVFVVNLKVNGPKGRDSVCKILSLSETPPPYKSAFNYFQEKCTGYPVGVSMKSINPSSTDPVWDIGNGMLGLSKELIVSLPGPGDYTIKYSSRLGNIRDTVIKIIRVEQ